MASDQKIELELAIRDTVSLTLRQIAQNLDNINKKVTKSSEGIKEGVESLDKIKQHTEGFGHSARRSGDAVRHLSQSVDLIKVGTRGPGLFGTVGGVVGIGLAIGKFATEALRNSAAARARLKDLSIDTGLTEEKLSILTQYGQKKGFAEEESQKIAVDLGTAINDMKSLGTRAPLFERLDAQNQGPLGMELIALAKKGDVGAAIDKAMDAIDKAYRESESKGRKLAGAFGPPMSYVQGYAEGIKDIKPAFSIDLETSKKILVEKAEFDRWMLSISNDAADTAIKIAERVIELTEKTNQYVFTTIRPDVLDPEERKRLKLPEITPEEAEQLRTSKEQRSLLLDILRSIKQSNDEAIEKRQFGGLVQAGRTYEVGERGAESFSSYGGVQPVVGIGEERRMLFRPNRSGAIMPDSNDPFVPPPPLRPDEQAVPGGTAAENYAALQRALRTRPFIGYDERENLPGQSGSNLFGDPEARFLKQQERGMEEQLKLPWWKFPDFGGDYVGPEGQQTSLDSALGGVGIPELNAEINFTNVPDDVTTDADSDGFDNFRINKTRQLEI
jgi:hypothetical protein